MRRRLTYLFLRGLPVVLALGLIGTVLAPGRSAAQEPLPVEVRPIVFPVEGPSRYADDFGAPRSGGRSHQGNDIFGTKLQHLVAAVDGTVTWVRIDDGLSISGNALTIRDAEGWRYLYIHLNNDTPGTDDGANPLEWAFAPGITVGSRVQAGQHVGYLGDSGNAERTLPHLHFEIRRPDNTPINPYPSLRLAQGHRVGELCRFDTNPARQPHPAAATGYWVLGGDGGVFALGDARFHGSTGAMRLNAPVIGMAATPSGGGYWLLARDGGIFSFGDARFRGSTGGMRLNEPVVGMAATPGGGGYWLVARDGGIFSFGDAGFRGSTGATRLNRPIVAMAATPSGNGYWLLGEDGGLFAFGDAGFHGSLPGTGRCDPPRAVDIVPTPTGQGYWIQTADGGTWAFGDAWDHGSTRRQGVSLASPAVALVPVP